MTVEQYITGRLQELETEVRSLRVDLMKAENDRKAAEENLITILNLLEFGNTTQDKIRQIYCNIWEKDKGFDTIRCIYEDYIGKDAWEDEE